MTKDLLAAKRYAQALFELSGELKKDEEIEAELVSFETAVEMESMERMASRVICAYSFTNQNTIATLHTSPWGMDPKAGS